MSFYLVFFGDLRKAKAGAVLLESQCRHLNISQDVELLNLKVSQGISVHLRPDGIFHQVIQMTIILSPKKVICSK